MLIGSSRRVDLLQQRLNLLGLNLRDGQGRRRRGHGQRSLDARRPHHSARLGLTLGIDTKAMPSAGATRTVGLATTRSHATDGVSSAASAIAMVSVDPRHDRFHDAAVAAPAAALPRPQSSRGGRRTAASARRCTSRAARGCRHPRAIASMPHRPGSPGPKRSSRRRRPRDRFARNAIVPERRRGRFVLLSNPRIAGLRFGDLCAGGL